MYRRREVTRDDAIHGTHNRHHGFLIVLGEMHRPRIADPRVADLAEGNTHAHHLAGEGIGRTDDEIVIGEITLYRYPPPIVAGNVQPDQFRGCNTEFGCRAAFRSTFADAGAFDNDLVPCIFEEHTEDGGHNW